MKSFDYEILVRVSDCLASERGSERTMPVAKAVAKVACANGIGRSILDAAARIFDVKAQTRITSQRRRLRSWKMSWTTCHCMHDDWQGRLVCLQPGAWC